MVLWAGAWQSDAGADGGGLVIARAYGLESFGRVEALRFTFNAQIGDKTVQRAWTWEPAQDRVALGGGQPLTYRRADLTKGPSADLSKVDAWFNNDQYWLLFPFHLAWDGHAGIVEDAAPQGLPLGQGAARRLTVTYPATGGYTPGDVFELFVDQSNRIVQWIYRQGGSTRPTRIATWEDHRRVGPLVLSLDHRGPDSFRVWFTDVGVRLIGQDQWTHAQ
jgi:hypothetical protein